MVTFLRSLRVFEQGVCCCVGLRHGRSRISAQILHHARVRNHRHHNTSIVSERSRKYIPSPIELGARTEIQPVPPTSSLERHLASGRRFERMIERSGVSAAVSFVPNHLDVSYVPPSSLRARILERVKLRDLRVVVATHVLALSGRHRSLCRRLLSRTKEHNVLRKNRSTRIVNHLPGSHADVSIVRHVEGYFIALDRKISLRSGNICGLSRRERFCDTPNEIG